MSWAADDYVMKSADSKELKEKIQNLLAKKPARVELTRQEKAWPLDAKLGQQGEITNLR